MRCAPAPAFHDPVSGASELQATSVYVRNMPPSAGKLFLYEVFARYGAILAVEVSGSGNAWRADCCTSRHGEFARGAERLVVVVVVVVHLLGVCGDCSCGGGGGGAVHTLSSAYTYLRGLAGLHTPRQKGQRLESAPLNIGASGHWGR
eukprot:365479-Chlamydomonas_euryale.AAC.15